LIRSPESAILTFMTHEVTDQYQLAGLSDLVPVGNRGGFSGARLWHGRWLGGELCVRAWPGGAMPERVETIHRLMDEASQTGLAFVPTVYRAASGRTCVVHDGKCWDLTGWMPGVADFHVRPSAARLANACVALAHLHCAWANTNARTEACPAVLRRLERIRQWQELVASGWQPTFDGAAPWHPWARRAWQIVQARMPELPGRLTPWLAVRLPLRACLCDIWHDHVLYTGDAVTGIVDYGSVKTDHVAVDLARLFGSLAGDDAQLRAAGLEAYTRIAPLSGSQTQLIDLLDETGTVIGAANWLLWLYRDGRTFADEQGVVRRLFSLVQRMEGWQAPLK
jgi:Ser/Thr protein kinase RdoA (MazF antagonist)